MKAKYLLRGLGLGMIITAVVMGAYTRSAVADARVAVLKEYGIGEEAALAETLVDIRSENGDKEDISEPPEPSSPMPEGEGQEPEMQSVSDNTETDEGQGTQDNVLEGSAANQPEEIAGAQSSTITIEISRGDDSGTVARKLYNAGLVESAAEYDAFLMQHGYDKKLSTGTKTINVTDSWLEIAEKIAGK